MENQKGKTELGTEQTKDKIEQVTKRSFSEFLKFFRKSVNLAKKGKK